MGKGGIGKSSAVCAASTAAADALTAEAVDLEAEVDGGRNEGVVAEDDGDGDRPALPNGSTAPVGGSETLVFARIDANFKIYYQIRQS